jgi:hypothetical protein
MAGFLQNRNIIFGLLPVLGEQIRRAELTHHHIWAFENSNHTFEVF